MVVEMDSRRPEKDQCVIAGDTRAKQKAMDMVVLIKNDTFWKVLPQFNNFLLFIIVSLTERYLG